MNGPVLAAIVDLGGSPRSVGWGWFQISIGNLAALIALVVLLTVTIAGRQSDG